MIAIEVRGERLGVVEDEDALHAIHALLPDGYMRLPVSAIRGEDGRVYQVADTRPLVELSGDILGAKEARKSAALAKLSDEDKEALGLIFAAEAREK